MIVEMENVDLRYEKLKANYLPLINVFNEQFAQMSKKDLKERAISLKQEVNKELRDRFNLLVDQQTDLLLQNGDLVLKFLPEAFALAREVTYRLLGMRHHDNQVIAGVALHLGNIVELKNGEGKTIAALLAAYLNALFVSAEFEIRSSRDKLFCKRNVHVMTSNGYLARRDYAWLKPIYDFLNVSIGYLQELHDNWPSSMSHENAQEIQNGGSYSMSRGERKLMYSADIVYGASHEFIFDYLRDSHENNAKKQTQAGHYFVIVDEADDILLDDAITPHILSGSNQAFENEEIEVVYLVHQLVKRMYKDQLLLNINDKKEIYVSGVGREVLRIIGQKIFSDSLVCKTLLQSIEPSVLLGLVFQFLAIVIEKLQNEFEPDICSEIISISNWSKRYCEFFWLDLDRNLGGLSQEGEEYIIKWVIIGLTQLPDEYLMSAKVVPWLLKMFKLMVRYREHMQGIFESLNTAFGISREDRQKIIRDLGRFTLKGLKTGDSDKQIAKWIVQILNDYIVDIANVSFTTIEYFRIFLPNAFIMTSKLFALYSNISLPEHIFTSIAKLEEAVFTTPLPSEVIEEQAPFAFATSVEFALLPVIANMLNPHVKVGKKDTMMIVCILGIRMVSEIISLEAPKNSFEREVRILIDELQSIISNRTFDVLPERQAVSLTIWGQMLVEDYAKAVLRSGLWSGATPGSITPQQVQSLNLKIRFLTHRCLSTYLFFNNENEYVIQNLEQPYRDNFTNELVNKEVVIVGDLTGRIMPGRRWQQWRHAFLEIKEGIPLKPDNEVIRSISSQSYLTLYKRRSGMTATAHIGNLQAWRAAVIRMRQTIHNLPFILKRQQDLRWQTISNVDPVKAEFESVYQMDIIIVPTHTPLVREDLHDALFISEEAKLEALINFALERHVKGQPVLIETVSVEQSRLVVQLLQKEMEEQGLQSNVQLLNALTVEQEAEIITNAGQIGALTVATQLAGRGTDIVIAKEVVQQEDDFAGLFVIGAERLRSRRWDDQIKGRAGRQGEPGVSKFFISLKDKSIKAAFPQSRYDAFVQRGWMPEKAELFGAELPEVLRNLVDDTILSQQIMNEHQDRRQREETAEFDKVLKNAREILSHLRQEAIEETYPCPLCGRPEHRIALQDENVFFCADCQLTLDQQGSEAIKNAPTWRLQFMKVVEESVDSYIRKDKLEQYLVDTYTADAVSPKQWNWDELASALSQRMNKKPGLSIIKFRLQKNIDLENDLFPQAERQKLIKNIRNILVEDAKTSLKKRSDALINQHYDRTRQNPRYWGFQTFHDLTRKLNSELLLGIYPEEVRSDPTYVDALSQAKSILAIKDFVRRAIDVEVTSYDWINSRAATIEQLLNVFNECIFEEKNKLKYSEVEDGMLKDEQDRRLYGHSMKTLVNDRLAISYNALIHRFGKQIVYEYENEVLCNQIDQNWSKFLKEADLLREELRGWTLEERVVDYGVQIARLFEHIYTTIAQETLRNVLLGKRNLVRKMLEQKTGQVKELPEEERAIARELLLIDREMQHRLLQKDPALVLSLKQTTHTGLTQFVQKGKDQGMINGSRQNMRWPGNSPCMCGSNQPFARCCGQRLYNDHYSG